MVFIHKTAPIHEKYQILALLILFDSNMCIVSKITLFRPIGKVPWLGRPIQSAKYRNYTIEKE